MSEEMNTVRHHRDMLLMESDWTQMPDSPLSDSKKAEWATYRQALRDITKNCDPKFDPSGSGPMTGYTMPTMPESTE